MQPRLRRCARSPLHTPGSLIARKREPDGGGTMGGTEGSPDQQSQAGHAAFCYSRISSSSSCSARVSTTFKVETMCWASTICPDLSAASFLATLGWCRKCSRACSPRVCRKFYKSQRTGRCSAIAHQPRSLQHTPQSPK
jgi:hypothetical protein